MAAAMIATAAAITRLRRTPWVEARGLGQQRAEHRDGESAAELAAGVEHAAGRTGERVGHAVQQHGSDRWHHQRPGEADRQHQHGDHDRRGGRGRGGHTSSPAAIRTSPAATTRRAPRRSAMRALNGVSTAPLTIIGRNTSPVWNADRPCSCWRYRLITNGSP